MKPSRIVLLLVALLAGGLAAYLATQSSNKPAQVVSVPEVIEEKKTQILVAVKPIGVGERLSPRTVQWQDWPEGAVRPEYITITASPDALEQITGAVARFEIFPGDPVLEQKLVRANQGYLSAVLEQGKRGVSIAVSADSASGGFIVPNDHVDVILTRQGETGQVSETILENVKVLAIGKRLGEAGATGAPSDPEDPRAEVFEDQTIATLELDPLQGETVINASKVGTLSLALRSIADFDAPPVTEVRRPRAASQTVRMIRFGQQISVSTGSTPAAGETVAIDPASYAASPVLAPVPNLTIPTVGGSGPAAATEE
ncbi:MAG TPA: Flp pilus assembly protein CpaB [Alphaproteobacteria bacterium]|nr:Flp pilus assembly protein CpaB [Alphaproteobacteria bacterium]